jgi:hypothetical protein
LIDHLTKPSILFLTAGVGGSMFEQAADRLINQASHFGIFTRLHAVKESELVEICPRLLDWFSITELRSTKGFGWYTWKATLAYEGIVTKRWGEFDLVMYLDAGCEMFRSSFSQKRLMSYLDHAYQKGNTLFSIETPEMEYTKRDLFEYFPNLDANDRSSQFQSGSWILRRDASAEFVSLWESFSKKGLHMTDESPSILPESQDFIIHRYDQSIFSLLAKSLGYTPITDTPPGQTNSFRGKMRAFFFPFWWARNRTGQSIIPKFMQIAGRLTLKP